MIDVIFAEIDMINGYACVLQIGLRNSYKRRSLFYYQWKNKVFLDLFFVHIIY